MKKQFTALFLCLICVFFTGCKNKDSETGSIDVDLSKLSGTMAFSALSDIMANPRTYLGKTIKAVGIYNDIFFEPTNQLFHYLVMVDAGGCCPLGIEFIWKGDHVYPDDYPARNAVIEIAGVFSSNEEYGSTYYYLSVDDIVLR